LVQRTVAEPHSAGVVCRVEFGVQSTLNVSNFYNKETETFTRVPEAMQPTQRNVFWGQEMARSDNREGPEGG